MICRIRGGYFVGMAEVFRRAGTGGDAVWGAGNRLRGLEREHGVQDIRAHRQNLAQ